MMVCEPGMSKSQYRQLLAKAIDVASSESRSVECEHVTNWSLNLLPYLRTIARNALTASKLFPITHKFPS
jgi:hypothetical protein